MTDDDQLTTNRRVIEQFRAGGEVDGMHRDRLLLLTTRGRRTGELRTTPVLVVDDDPTGLRFVVASGAGSPRVPGWFHNLVDQPVVHVEVAGDAYDAVARVAGGTERDGLWERLVEAYPFFVEHEKQAGRELPLVILDRR
ncbi:nitroreductase/quinone reductase family protein [Luteimicrobium xylanilyticum]|uniref:Prolyl aminopeptidase n=1 Tax=Luteimicrobium xylanilyticum TaxID=1133546 RepID=A0A5P9QFB2_9MICO|nr:nitroreductase/quinone reductase family protein [Luteimicrobium xylanilyticum]QFU99936.1 Prolyl aminopeptidase [Luteimicrobium xylanilyticum]